MVHGDNSGLKLPPRVAPVQAMITPIAQNKEGVLEKAREIEARLKAAGVRVKLDDSDKRPGFKFAEQEMRGIPVRIEIGPKDIEQNQAIAARRDTGEKATISLDTIDTEIVKLLETIQQDMYNTAKTHRDAHTYSAAGWDEFKDYIDNKPGFVKAMWCGEQDCEDRIKDELTATSRCIPFEQEKLSDHCVCCGKPAKTLVYWGKAY